MGRSWSYCVECDDELGPGIDPPCLCRDCSKKYPWAEQECQNAYNAGWARGWNESERKNREAR
jgi:hypothetical protein